MQMVFMNKIWMSKPCIKIIKGGFLGLRWKAHNENQEASFIRRLANYIRSALTEVGGRENTIIWKADWLGEE